MKGVLVVRLAVVAVPVGVGDFNRLLLGVNVLISGMAFDVYI